MRVIDGGGITFKKVHSQENCANMFTKLVLLEKLWCCLGFVGLQKRWWMGLGKVSGKKLSRWILLELSQQSKPMNSGGSWKGVSSWTDASSCNNGSYVEDDIYLHSP